MKALIFDFKIPRLAYSKIFGMLSQEAYFGRFSALRYVDYNEPDLPGDEWVKVKTDLCGICASDLHAIFLTGSMDSPITPFVSFPMPFGHEVVGTVEQTGKAVDNLVEGERVLIIPMLSCVTRGIDPPCPACQEGNVAICRNFAEGDLPPGLMMGANWKINGGFAPYVVAHRDHCLKIPEDVSFEDAVVADPFATSLHAILQNPPKPGDKVLVYSLGTLGLAAVMSLSALYPECHIIAAGRYPFQNELAKKYGAHEIIDSGDKIFSDVEKITGGKVYQVRRGRPILIGGVDIVYDCVGSAETIETSLRLTKEKGKVVLIGADIPKRFEWSPIWFREVTLVGSMAAGADDFQGKTIHTFARYLELVRDGVVDVKPFVTHKFRLEEYKEALRTCLDKRSTNSIKVVFDFT